MVGKVFLVTEPHEVSQTLLPTFDINGCHILIEQLLTDTVVAQIEGMPGLPFLLSNKVLDKLTEVENYKFNKMANIRSYVATITLDGKKVKEFPSITMSDDDGIARADLIDKLKKYHNIDFGTHYDDISFEWKGEEELKAKPIDKKPKETPFPKEEPVAEEEDIFADEPVVEQAKPEEPAAEEVETVEVEEVVEVQEIKETEFSINFPAIPEKFFIETDKEIREYSLEVVAEKAKEAEDLLKKAIPENYGDDKLFEKIDRLRKDMVKERTNPNTYFQTKLDKPVKRFLKDVQGKITAIGTEAQAVQDKLQKAIDDRANHIAEQERLEDERKTKLALDRATKLQAVGGIYDPASKSVTVEGIGLFLDSQLRDGSDEDFDTDLADATKLFNDAQDKKKEDDAKLEATQKILLKYRTRDLQDHGFVHKEAFWESANGTRVVNSEVVSLSEEDFEAKLEQSKEAAKEATQSTETKEENKDTAPIEITSYATPKEPETKEVPQTVTLDFSELGYIDIMFAKSIMRIYPIGNDTVALNGLDQAKVLAPATVEELGLKFVPVKL